MAIISDEHYNKYGITQQDLDNYRAKFNNKIITNSQNDIFRVIGISEFGIITLIPKNTDKYSLFRLELYCEYVDAKFTVLGSIKYSDNDLLNMRFDYK